MCTGVTNAIFYGDSDTKRIEMVKGRSVDDVA
jgi:hypothetical protein